MTKDFQVRQSDKSLFKNELSVQFKMISTRVLKKFMPLMGPLGKEKNTLSSPRKLSSTKNYFNFKQPFLWTSHHEQECSCVKKPRGRPPYKANKQLVSKADRTVFPEIHRELPQLRDIS